jgi:hypothetical protein
MNRTIVNQIVNTIEANGIRFEFEDRNLIGAYLLNKLKDKDTFLRAINHSIPEKVDPDSVYEDCLQPVWIKKATEANFIDVLLQNGLLMVKKKDSDPAFINLPSIETKPQDKIKVLLDKARVSITEEITSPLDCLMVDTVDSPIPIGTLGNISMVTGIAKSKKTFLVSAITASLISEKPILKFVSKLPAGRKILYFDTEQGPSQTHKVFRRILEMAGIPTDKDPDNLHFFRIRPHNKDERIEMIQRCLYENRENLAVVIIDGIRDLVSNINDPDESTKVSNALMKWSEELGIHIITVLHLNKGDKNPRGHLGTEMSNKSETVLSIEPLADSGISEIRGMFTRDRTFDPFHILINENGHPELTESLPGSPNDFSTYEPQTLKNLLSTIFINRESPMSYNDLWKTLKLKAPYEWRLSHAKSKELVHFLEREGYIINGNNKGTKMKSYTLKEA